MEPMAEKKVEKAEVESRKQVRNLEPNLFDGALGNSQALTIDAEPARSERQMFGLTQNYLDYKYEFRNNS